MDALPPEASFAVSAELAGERLDRALAELVPGTSRARLQELIRDGGVSVDGVALRKPSQALAAGQRIVLRAGVPRTRERAGGAADVELVLVHEDEHLAVIDKPPGRVSHPAGRVKGGTVSELAVARWGPLPALQGDDRPGIVHRLDADTSGLLVIAKTEVAARALVEQFRARRVEKAYLAVVFGEPRFDSDWIELPLGRSPERSDRMSVLEGGKQAVTFYETVERFDGFGLVRCQPKTGRTHQIRVHLAHIDHPLVGDRVYRGRRGLSRHVPRGGPGLERHALHASRLAFDHPVTGARLELEAPLAPDLQAFVDWLRAR